MAITMVLLSHMGYIFQGFDILGLQLLGVQGVEIFFVLSGFLIGGILLRLLNASDFSKTDVLYFWVRRWFRTLPLYFLMLGVNVLIALIVDYGLPDNLWKYIFFLQNFHGSHTPFFPESWSLSVEEYAYIIAPISLYVINKMYNTHKNKKELFLWASVILVVLFLALKVCYYVSTIHTLHSLSLWNSNLKAIVIYRLDAVFYGFIMVYYFNRFKERMKYLSNTLFIIGFTLSALVLVVIPYLGFTIERYPFYWNVLYLPLNSLGISLMLPAFYFLKAPKERFASFVKHISIYSYAMYLLHYTFILYIMQLLMDFKRLNIFERILCTILYFITTYFLSKVVYHYFEKPFTAIRDNLRIRQFFNR